MDESVNLYSIFCPNCGKEFKVKYKNNDTYCDCKLPYEMQLVPSCADIEWDLLKKNGYIEWKLERCMIKS